MGLLADKVLLVTGGGSGIGRATAYRASREGAAVLVADVNVAGGEETAHHIQAEGGAARFIKADVTRADEVEAMVRAAVETFGKLDAAVNNAGISGGMMARVHELEEALFDQVIAVNLKGVWLCMKYEIMAMEPKGGVIVNVASVAGLIGAPKGSAYTASKHGVVGLTKAAAIEYARRGIRINAVCPAYTETPMVTDVINANPEMERLTLAAIPMRRLADPTEIAEGIVWLCAPAASFVTGHTLVLDGGLTAT